MAKTGQMNIFGTLFWIILFLILFGVALSPIIATMSGTIITVTGLTGIEAWIIGNLVLWVLLAFIMMILWVTNR